MRSVLNKVILVTKRGSPDFELLTIDVSKLVSTQVGLVRTSLNRKYGYFPLTKQKLRERNFIDKKIFFLLSIDFYL
ncbi:hypothetical protein BpHYR1_011889 [Brachionus plicatilis]|uniref:Uncharacterized protein n=1 Tax=Brachionus plicatilis TaxID=10195 RepID=A0A3M7RPY6_BRAPC|nr:hypothetical protein BpHYR1_011889 [Brachionus plicatilis]